MMTGMAVAMVDMGIVSVAIEAAALSKQIAGVAQKYPDNSVIQSVFSMEAIKSGTVKMQKPEVKPEDIKSGVLVDQAIDSINNALQILDGKATPGEIQQYKEFVYSCGEAVANAAGSGMFGSGTKVTEGEKVALEKFKTAIA
ncbi:MAG: hypothetical protein HC835_05270 [Oscillatoriales cyanobacterium RM2_1_1]|nr:hypothetical protein [Oscillatoriales cyanobacterium SM2_3_0]NJO45074.1 hypothetical protein [Oscillatoriales cyanobacterium RM2_1_1]